MTNTTASAIHTLCKLCDLEVEVWTDDPKIGRDRGGNMHCNSGGLHVPSLDMDTIIRENYLAEKREITAAMVAAPFTVDTVTTSVELHLPEDAPAVRFEDTGTRRIKVSVTRFPNDSDNDPYFHAEAWVIPTDRRKAPHWTYLPREVAQQLIWHAIA
jgi:hypothetical protein